MSVLRSGLRMRVLWVGVAVCLAACEAAPGPGGLPLVRDSAGVTIVEVSASAVEEAPLLELTDPVFTLGSLDGPDEERFTSVVDAARLPDGGFVIVDEREAQGVRIYGPDGAFRRSLGGQGEGPGEFLRPASVRIDQGGAVWIWDAGGMRMNRYRPDGDFEGTVPRAELGDGGIVAFVPRAGGATVLLREESVGGPPDAGTTRRRNRAHLLRSADGTADLDTLATFPGTEWELRVQADGGQIASIEIVRPWYLARLLHAFAAGDEDGGGLWLSDGTRWEAARRHAQSGALELVVRVDREPDPFNAARTRELHDAQLARAADEEEADAVRRRSSQARYPERIPPIADLFADAQGRPWVGLMEFPPPPALPWSMGRPVREWLILAADGRSLEGRVELPPRSRPLHADDEGLLLVRTDDLGIPFVEWRRLESSGTRDP